MGFDNLDDMDDDHMRDLYDVLGVLPENLKWFGPNGKRINPYAEKHDDAEEQAEDKEPFMNVPLEVLFERNKPDDIDAEEAAVVTTLIRHILKYDPSERPSAEELLKEKWLEDA
ncbi:hypothetical protein QBC46DRAFT_406245 [Diplogelasinospora grovesii]|uniref:Protein kinase domain-containing protein n=1 Tax=Diplogelasinospora grovesii TaxID=303347 RepID=A0AAN6S6R9_9PEZI|nr:hypothetical protein QBC46DRAFT_406245 [Diplogelasinospora grovesii]